MPFIPHTAKETEQMLKAIGATNIEALFDEIPEHLRAKPFESIPEGMSELALNRLANQCAFETKQGACFIGAGAYEHHIPAAVWEIASRGEFLTAYTPYQAEASQGTLQLLYEYQSMMASLNALDVSNASLYDGASALAEAILMAVRAQKKHRDKTILVPSNLHPHYRDVVQTIVCNQGIELIDIAFDETTGLISQNALEALNDTPFTALVIANPNFFGGIESIHTLTNWAHEKGALVIGCVNPTALALLTPPGQWGDKGADIACGEGQPLGVPLASGGPYFGFLCAKMALVRQMPGRIIGRTKDATGKTGFSLTLQAREQHIRRSKATSNICTNQGLLVTAATIYMSLMGPDGLKSVALKSHQNLIALTKCLSAIDGISPCHPSTPHFHEALFAIDGDVHALIASMQQKGFEPGLFIPKAQIGTTHDALLICVTETKTSDDLSAYAKAMSDSLREQK